MPTTLPTSSRADLFAGPNFKIVTGACSAKGTRRDQYEDASYVSPNMDLFIVADGMGGHRAGEVASKFAVDTLASALATRVRDPLDDDEIESIVQAALRDANCLISSLGNGNTMYRGAATTVVLALLFKSRLYVTGVGDSRAYLVRDGAIEALTIDDSGSQFLLDAGVISAEQARTHPWRHQLTSALGLEDFQPSKRIRVIELRRQDRLLLTSDGVTNVLEDDQILAMLQKNDNPQPAAESLVRAAVENDAGDDLTCVVAYVGEM